METKSAGTVLRIAGPEELSAANADLFRKKVGAALDRHTVVEVDLSQTAAMDCRGLGALITVRNLTRGRDGGVRLVGATPMVQRLFDVMRAGDLFEIVQIQPPAEGSPESAAG